MQHTLQKQWARVKQEFDHAFGILGNAVNQRLKTPVLDILDDIIIARYQQCTLEIPYAIVHDLLPSVQEPESIRRATTVSPGDSECLNYFQSCMQKSSTKQGSSCKQKDTALERILKRQEALRLFGISRLSGIVFQHEMNNVLEDQFQGMLTKEREESPVYWFWSQWAMTSAGLAYIAHHPQYACHANWLAEEIRANATMTLKGMRHCRDISSFAGQAYAAQIFCEDSLTHCARLKEIFKVYDPWKLHARMRSPLEEFQHVLGSPPIGYGNRSPL
jgi:hypothetical protein